MYVNERAVATREGGAVSVTSCQLKNNNSNFLFYGLKIFNIYLYISIYIYIYILYMG